MEGVGVIYITLGKRFSSILSSNIKSSMFVCVCTRVSVCICVRVCMHTCVYVKQKGVGLHIRKAITHNRKGDK